LRDLSPLRRRPLHLPWPIRLGLLTVGRLRLATIVAVAPGILVVSEVFPPAIGGSGALLENVYRRISDRHVRVLAHDAPPGVPPYDGPLEVSHVSMTAPDWGLVRPSSFRRHLHVAAAIRAALDAAPATIHCARALPEGLSAAMALWGRGGAYVCWLHGEELGFASTSRELTWLARRVYKGAAAVIANSNNSRQLLVREWNIPESRVHVIYPGVDIDRFRPDIDGRAARVRVASDDHMVLLSVGRLQRRKGHDMVLRTLARVRQTLPRLRYVIVGDGPYQAQLEAEAAELGVTDIVHFVGPASEAELPAWYAAADVFVMPNRSDGVDFEGFGIVFLEAAAAGLPVIGGRSGGVPEAVEDQVTGRLVDGTDVAAIERAVCEMATSTETRRECGRAGRARAVQRFGWDRAVREIRRVCATIDDPEHRPCT
jgi:phosphatidyl-myo-inositol dimannoside synthase